MMISHNNLHFSLIFSHFYVKIAILSNKNAEKSLFYCTFVTIKNWRAIFAHTDISRIKTNIHTYLFMKKIFLSAALLQHRSHPSHSRIRCGCATLPSRPMAPPSFSPTRATSTAFLHRAVRLDSSPPTPPSTPTPSGARTGRR